MLHHDFPRDPHKVIEPMLRWHPGDELLDELGYEKLIPPLLHKIRKGVKAWRDGGYNGASETSRALLNYWFNEPHIISQSTNVVMPAKGSATMEFRYYFCQREAVESVIWLYEVEQARDPYALMKYDSSGRVALGMFSETWTRYVMKLATGAGKTKVMSLLLAWSYFHKKYEEGSTLSQNFLVLAPNIIVLERLRQDFDGLKVFRFDPVLPHNGYMGQNWENDFQPSLHIQDTIGPVNSNGNIFLSNIHRVYEGKAEPSFEDEDTTDYFLGPRPTGATTDSGLNLSDIVRSVPDLVVINDEAHHIHDPEMAWFKNIADIHAQLKLRGSRLSAQFDLTATPKHNKGEIFVQTISDYPLVEAIRQGVVKTPVLPDEASRAKLQERQSDKYVEQYEDYLQLGYVEWRKTYDDLVRAGKKAVLFVMTDETANCNEVAEYLESRFADLRGKVLTIHTKRNGEISETAGTKEAKELLDELRRQSREIDGWESPYLAIVSVMMLREGWDVNNVTAIVGLRPYKAKSQILPEQTLGRGLRRMFRGQDIKEKVSVIGTDGFIQFVEQIQVEGVELEYAAMGAGTAAKSPMVIEVDRQNEKKDIEKLDIELPILAPRIQRDYRNLNELDPAKLRAEPMPLRQYSAEEVREIVFKDIDTDEESHRTVLDTTLPPNAQGVIGYFVDAIRRRLRLVGGLDVLYGKVKQFVEEHLFGQTVDINDPQVLRNLSELETRNALVNGFASAINALTVSDSGTTRVVNQLRFSEVRPHVVNPQDYVVSHKTIFSRIVGDSAFELEFARFLDKCDIISFVKNQDLRIEYVNADSGISNYYPDFVVHEKGGVHWIIETKGRVDLDDPLKIERLKQWCADATAQEPGRIYRALYVQQEDWDAGQPRNFDQLATAFPA